jgi:hypothetical protein
MKTYRLIVGYRAASRSDGDGLAGSDHHKQPAESGLSESSGLLDMDLRKTRLTPLANGGLSLPHEWASPSMYCFKSK